MNYANMIEEGRLKKGFIIATLVSTVLGTFSASMALADKLQERRDRARQKGVDKGQDDKIKMLNAKVEELERGGTSRRRKRDDSADEEDLAQSVHRSRMMIERMYEDHLKRAGDDYARGDLLTENKLQAQVIKLQQSVITVLQTALSSGRQLTDDDLRKLLAAQRAAREGSMDALQDQYRRLMAGRDETQVSALGFGPPRRQLTYPERDSSSGPDAPPRRANSMPARRKRLFCRYSEDLQNDSQAPLALEITSEGGSRCPDCDVYLDTTPRSAWIIDNRRVTARFVAKCHTEDGRFACVLCNRYRSMDCLCRSIEALVRHLVDKHSAEEIYRDADIEIKGVD